MSKLPITICFVSILAGCAMHHDDDISMAQLEAYSVNAYSVNAYSVNAYSVNAYSVNALSSASLADGTYVIDSSVSHGLETTEDGREVLTYLSRCALGEDQILTTVVDGVRHDFPGLLGLARNWVHRRLVGKEPRVVTACMLAHANAYGVSIPISLRGWKLGTDKDEEQLFGLHEATFYGNMFSDEPRMYVCSATDTTLAREMSTYRAWRVCSETSDGSLSECSPDEGPAFIVTGACEDVCSKYKNGEGWSKCGAPDTGEVYHSTINSWLIDGE